MRPPLSGRTLVAGVAGHPVSHSLSPTLHNAWIAAAGLDAVYVAFAPPARGFTAFAMGLRGGAIRGLNVTAPFKEDALALADRATPRARAAGAANLLVFESSGQTLADNTDGEGLLAALAAQAPAFDLAARPVAILGAGGATRGVATALLEAGAPTVRIVNRGLARAENLVAMLGPRASAFRVEDSDEALTDAGLVINAIPAGADAPPAPLERLAPGSVVMDMAYRPLTTPLLRRAEALGQTPVDGLAMLIGQAAPSFETLFGVAPPDIDVRRVALAVLEAEG